MISLLVPVFNEEESAAQTIERAHRALSSQSEDFEIIVINDGSTDKTASILESFRDEKIRVISRTQNTGYGSSIKTGIRKSKGNLIATVDADGTYPIEDFPKLIAKIKESGADMAVGSRTKPGVKFEFKRRIGKFIIGILANKAAGMKIPDNNSGMRIFTRELAESFMHLYPQKFSLTLTLTLAALTNGYEVVFVPIDYFKRTGKSTLSFRHFWSFFAILLRVTTYFNPLKFFIWPSGILLLSGIAMIAYTVSAEKNVSDTGLLLFLTGLQIGLFGVLAEAVVRNRQKTA